MKTCEAKICILASESEPASWNTLSNTLLTKGSFHIKSSKKHHLVIPIPHNPAMHNHILITLHICYLIISHREVTWKSFIELVQNLAPGYTVILSLCFFFSYVILLFHRAVCRFMLNTVLEIQQSRLSVYIFPPLVTAFFVGFIFFVVLFSFVLLLRMYVCSGKG